MQRDNFWEYVELEEYSIYSVYSTAASGIAGSWKSCDRFRWTLDFELLFRIE